MSKMLVVQIQPNLASSSSSDALAESIRRVADGQVLIRDGESQGDDDGPYINIVFRADDLAAGWSMIKAAFGTSSIGSDLVRSTIVTCEGDCGWSDYKLLHHFDPTEELDSP